MENNSGVPADAPFPGQSRRILGRPRTRLGWWSAALAGVFVALIIAGILAEVLGVYVPEMLMPFLGIFMILCGLAAGSVGLVAVFRRGERSWLVWFAVLVGLFALSIILFEFLAPH